MRRIKLLLILVGALALGGLVWWRLQPIPLTPGAYAIQYALSRFPEHYVIEGGGQGNIDFGWYVFLIRETSGWTLIDTGPAASRPEVPFVLRQPKSLRQLLAGLGCSQVDTILLTHGHWDHAGGVEAFPEAQVYLSQSEWDSWHQVLGASRWAHAYRRGDLEALEKIKDQGRLHLFQGELQKGAWKAVAVGGHTAGMLAVEYRPQGQLRLLLAGDNEYLYRNLEEGRPIPEESRAGPEVLSQLRQQAGSVPLVPGHDPALMGRYPLVAPQVVRLCGGAP